MPPARSAESGFFVGAVLSPVAIHTDKYTSDSTARTQPGIGIGAQAGYDFRSGVSLFVRVEDALIPRSIGNYNLLNIDFGGRARLKGMRNREGLCRTDGSSCILCTSESWGWSDQSPANLSSIQLFAEADGITMLLTGDGRSDHLVQALSQAGLLDGAGKLHVDLLKLAHHGSNRNVTKTFFKKITADIYVASADGRDDNPDLTTLIWIVEAAKEANRDARNHAGARPLDTNSACVINPRKSV